MINKEYSKITIFALTLSILAILLSGFSWSKTKNATLDDKEFMAKVEKGIENYIAKQRAAQAGADTTAPTEPVNVSIGNSPIMGDKNAPVTIVEFSDFECPFCGRFSQTTLPQIITDYIEKGKVQLVYRNFPLSFHKNSRNASNAALCAREQGGDKVFFKYHDTLYINQTSFSDENFKKWATDLGLKATQFNSCYDTKKYDKEIDTDFNEGQSYGVTGTPALFVNGYLITGAQPYSVFQTKIDEELKK